MSQRSLSHVHTEIGSIANKTTTTNVYTDVGILSCARFRTKHFVFTATTNNLYVQILGSIDGGSTYPITAVSQFTVTVGTPNAQTITVPYTHLKVQVDPVVDNNHGTLATRWFGATW